MSKTTDLIDEARQRLNLTSNYQLALKLQISQADISAAYKGKYRADEYTATRLALALGLEPIHVIAELRAEDEKNPTKREFWESFLSRVASVTALAVALGLGWPPSSAADTLAPSDRADDISIHYPYTGCREAGGPVVLKAA